MKNVNIPPGDVMSDYNISAHLPGRHGTGDLKSKGRINLKTKDTNSNLVIKNLDITELKSYYEKKGDVEITKGFISVDSKIAIKSSRINSSGKMVLRDLEFASGGSTFLGVPRSAVIKLLKDSNNEIALDFTIEGDLNNPKFNITESLVQKISLSIAKSLGMPIETIGKSVFEFGGQAIKKIFK